MEVDADSASPAAFPAPCTVEMPPPGNSGRAQCRKPQQVGQPDGMAAMADRNRVGSGTTREPAPDDLMGYVVGLGAMVWRGDDNRPVRFGGGQGERGASRPVHAWRQTRVAAEQHPRLIGRFRPIEDQAFDVLDRQLKVYQRLAKPLRAPLGAQ